MTPVIQYLEAWKKILLYSIFLFLIVLIGMNVHYYSLFQLLENLREPNSVNQVVFLKFFSVNSQIELYNNIPMGKSDFGLGVILSAGLSITTSLWLLLYSITNYLKLANFSCFKLGTLIDCCVIAAVFLFFLRPESQLLFILDIVLLVVNFIVLLVYWFYQKKKAHEKR